MMYHMVIYQHWGYYWSFIGSQRRKSHCGRLGWDWSNTLLDSPLEIASLAEDIRHFLGTLVVVTVVGSGVLRASSGQRPGMMLNIPIHRTAPLSLLGDSQEEKAVCVVESSLPLLVWHHFK